MRILLGTLYMVCALQTIVYRLFLSIRVFSFQLLLPPLKPSLIVGCRRGAFTTSLAQNLVDTVHISHALLKYALFPNFSELIMIILLNALCRLLQQLCHRLTMVQVYRAQGPSSLFKFHLFLLLG